MKDTKILKEYIKKVLAEIDKPITPDSAEKIYNLKSLPKGFREALKVKLNMNPLTKYVKGVKFPITMPPSVTIILPNDNVFDMFYDGQYYSIRSEGDVYSLLDKGGSESATRRISKLLTVRSTATPEAPEEEDKESTSTPSSGGGGGGGFSGGGTSTGGSDFEPEGEEGGDVTPEPAGGEEEGPKGEMEDELGDVSPDDEEL